MTTESHQMASTISWESRDIRSGLIWSLSALPKSHFETMTYTYQWNGMVPGRHVRKGLFYEVLVLTLRHPMYLVALQHAAHLKPADVK